MIYLIFWLCLMALQLPYYYLSFILGFTVLLCPRGHRRFLLYTLVLALTVANVQSIWRHYNAIDLGESVGGYVYRIASNKADIYIDGRKYRLKAKGLTDELEGRCIVIKAVTLQRQKTLNRHSYNYQRHYQLLGYSGYIKGRVARAITRWALFTYLSSADFTSRRLAPSCFLYCLMFLGFPIDWQMASSWRSAHCI